MPHSTSVLFVCLGNICRSPMAEGVFRHLVEEEGVGDRIRVDSAGTSGWHLGEGPDARAARTARSHGVTLSGAARQLRPEDLKTFAYVIAMDRSNLEDIQKLARRTGGTASLRLLREFDPQARSPLAEVPDPYYGGPGGFEEVFQMVLRSARGLLDHLRERGEGPAGPRTPPEPAEP